MRVVALLLLACSPARPEGPYGCFWHPMEAAGCDPTTYVGECHLLGGDEIAWLEDEWGRVYECASGPMICASATCGYLVDHCGWEYEDCP